jgi:hypothetical protein
VKTRCSADARKIGVSLNFVAPSKVHISRGRVKSFLLDYSEFLVYIHTPYRYSQELNVAKSSDDFVPVHASLPFRMKPVGPSNGTDAVMMLPSSRL